MSLIPVWPLSCVEVKSGGRDGVAQTKGKFPEEDFEGAGKLPMTVFFSTSVRIHCEYGLSLLRIVNHATISKTIH